jgi:uncharacterized RDD family membrane protein YckC
MNIPSEKQSLGGGVFYDQKDYKGLSLRLLILATDLIVLGSCCYAIIYFGYHLDISDEAYFNSCFFGSLIISYIYLALIKRTHIGTLGYYLTKSKIVNLSGQCPSILTMTYRYLLLIFGPLNLLYDLLWVSGDDNKQTLRDKLARTYVVNKQAEPLGSGDRILAPYFFFGFSYLFTEVKRPKEQANHAILAVEK